MVSKHWQFTWSDWTNWKFRSHCMKTRSFYTKYMFFLQPMSEIPVWRIITYQPIASVRYNCFVAYDTLINLGQNTWDLASCANCFSPNHSKILDFFFLNYGQIIQKYFSINQFLFHPFTCYSPLDCFVSGMHLWTSLNVSRRGVWGCEVWKRGKKRIWWMYYQVINQLKGSDEYHKSWHQSSGHLLQHLYP